MPELPRTIETITDVDAPDQDRLAAMRLAFSHEDSDPFPWLSGWSGELVALQRAARARTERNSWWPSGRAPILDLVALQDPFRPEDQRDVYRTELGDRVEVVTIDGASHALPDERPAETAAALARWIAQLS